MAKRIYCNKCGKEMDEFDIQEQFSVQTRLGYDGFHPDSA